MPVVKSEEGGFGRLAASSEGLTREPSLRLLFLTRARSSYCAESVTDSRRRWLRASYSAHLPEAQRGGGDGGARSGRDECAVT